ncbi:hypothetical protein HAHE_18100 [Haloferula helveola]|uniref:Uncharacterized protein n=1 Tax=Haloferula helveola TaxID=490095 RepID=A0ABM7RCW2_9BACT|nr:hypothetical protein HAHE_18100 [Haloferula helveola]
MRIRSLAIATLLVPQLHAAPLSEADRQALIEQLDELKGQAGEQATTRLKAAAAAFSSAMKDEDAATELYVKCIEKVDFEMQDRDSSAFRDWKRRNKDRLDEEGHGLALRHQLRWAVLTLQAASDRTKTAELAPELLEALEAIYRDPKALSRHFNILGQPVDSTVFARAYGLSGYKIENWPMSPLQAGRDKVRVDAPFQLVIFPALRQKKDFAGLREAWDRRIHFEDVTCGFWSGGDAEDGMSPERIAFTTDTRPMLEWEKEEDLFKQGDQQTAAVAMLTHLKNHIGHSHARDWEARFRELVEPKDEATDTQG